MTDSIRRAYTVLGLPTGSPYPEVRKRYVELVKTWHPDRFASDPQGQAEAGERLRVINAAYSTLERSTQLPGGKSAADARRPMGRRLTRDEIDAIVAAIGSDGPLDDLFRAFERLTAPLENIVGAVLARVTTRGSG